MSNLQELTKIIWENSTNCVFGGYEKWSENLFLEEYFGELWDNTQGWYWFSALISPKDLKNLKLPRLFPNNGINFSETAKKNLEIFGNNIAKEKNVLYNGQNDKVLSRIRAHYILANDNTSALGIMHYTGLAEKDWSLYFFTMKDLEKIDGKEREQIEKLIREKTGRIAIEQTWRSIYGWPILCKK